MEEEKVIGYINFDGTTGENNRVEIKIPNEKLTCLRRGQYVVIESVSTGETRKYLAQIVQGPFYQPDAFGKDSAFAMASILQADRIKFRPEYHGVCYAQLLGEIENPERYLLKNPELRPFPQAAVRELSTDAIENLLLLKGSLYFGQLLGYRGIKVSLKNSKEVIPRNIGIFGTVGSGKTNTSQVLIEEASKNGWAVVVLDVEGEYVRMNKPTHEVEKKEYKDKMDVFDVKPEGIVDFKLYHCTGAEESEANSAEFGVRFEDLDPFVLAEILELNTVQVERFLEVHYKLKARERKPQTKTKGVLSDLGEKDRESMGVTLKDFIKTVEEIVESNNSKGGDKSSYLVILRKLRKLQRTRIIDESDTLDTKQLIKPNRVSVIDMSNSYDLWIKNIIISDILRRIFEEKTKKDANETHTLIVIEEAHSFVSKGKEKQMGSTLGILQDIARRGRKRWLGLCFISQQPAHLPDEIYELCNTKIIHKITGKKNLDAIKTSAGDVDSDRLGEIPMLMTGSALVISPQFRYPIMVEVRPCLSDRKHID